VVGKQIRIFIIKHQDRLHYR